LLSSIPCWIEREVNFLLFTKGEKSTSRAQEDRSKSSRFLSKEISSISFCFNIPSYIFIFLIVCNLLREFIINS